MPQGNICWKQHVKVSVKSELVHGQCMQGEKGHYTMMKVVQSMLLLISGPPADSPPRLLISDKSFWYMYINNSDRLGRRSTSRVESSHESHGHSCYPNRPSVDLGFGAAPVGSGTMRKSCTRPTRYIPWPTQTPLSCSLASYAWRTTAALSSRWRLCCKAPVSPSRAPHHNRLHVRSTRANK